MKLFRQDEESGHLEFQREGFVSFKSFETRIEEATVKTMSRKGFSGGVSPAPWSILTQLCTVGLKSYVRHLDVLEGHVQ